MKKTKDTKKKLTLRRETLNNAQKTAVEKAHGGFIGSTGGPEYCSTCAY